MTKPTFKQFLMEAPIGDYQTFGDFSKNSSFRKPRDRFLITNPRTVEIVKKKFDNTEYLFNFYFVNSPKANKHTELGEVSFDWVEDNLGKEVSDAVEKNLHTDSMNIIFTNNKGAEGMPLTGWMMGHRIMHALARKNSMRTGRGSPYVEASNELIRGVSDCMEYYGKTDFPNSEDRLTYRSSYSSDQNRRNQLLMLSFFYEVATFKSARDKNIRDWFEVLNELGAQYLTTGKIKFNKAPSVLRLKGPNGFTYNCKDIDSVNDNLEMLARDMQYYIDSIFSSSVNKIFVM